MIMPLGLMGSFYPPGPVLAENRPQCPNNWQCSSSIKGSNSTLKTE